MLVFTDTATQQVLETALDAIIVTDADSRVVVWNHSSEVIFGFSKSEAIGKPLVKLIIPAHLAEAHNAGVARYMATGKGPLVGTRTEIIAQRADGMLIDVELALDIISGQTRTYFIARCRDVTERRHAQERQASLTAQLAEAVRELHHRVGNMAANAAAAIRLTERAAHDEARAAEIRRIALERIQALAQEAYEFSQVADKTP